MTWEIGPIVLPIDPESIERRVLRKQEANNIIEQFGIPIDVGPDAFEFTVKGKIWPTQLSNQLWETTKKAEQATIQILVTNDPQFEVYTDRYAVNKSSVKISGPNFVKQGGVDVPVYSYNITFVQFAGQGDTTDGDSGDIDLDEDGVGFDIEDVFGSFDFSDFLNTINDFFTI